MLYKMTEWQGGSGKWYCNCVDNLANNSGAWYHPARILDISPSDFVLKLVEEFNADIFHNADCSFVGYFWTKQSDMRRFKNYINGKARQKNYQV